MDWFVKRFVKASLVWFGLGITLGALMTVRPALVMSSSRPGPLTTARWRHTRCSGIWRRLRTGRQSG